MKAKYVRELARLEGRYPREMLMKQLVEIERVEDARKDERPIEAGREWYNYRYDRHSDTTVEYTKHPSQSRYAPCWQAALRFIGKKERVADFGCGVGQFAQLVFESGGKYVLGVDFSNIAIAQAKERNAAHAACFLVRDLYDPEVYQLAEYEVAVFLETMEHLERDLYVLAKIPEGTKVILSVPNFLSYGHTRWFRNVEAARARYAPYVTIQKIRRFSFSEGHRIWLICGVKNAYRTG